MAIVCDDLDLLYLCTDKTGSTSVSNLLLDELGGRWVPPDHIWADGELVVDFKHSSLADLVRHDVLGPDDLARMEIAITVRNPFAWVLSGFRYRRKVYRQRAQLGAAAPDWMQVRGWDIEDAARLDFDDYVAGRYDGRRDGVAKRFVAGYTDLPHLTYLRIEHIDDELSSLLDRLGVGWEVSVPRTNRTDGDEYTSVYSARSRAIVTAAFADDLDQFGYEF